MAQIEIPIGGGLDGQVTVYVRYNDQAAADGAMECNRFRWENTSGRSLDAAFVRPDGSSTKITIPASGGGTRALPPGTLALIPRTDPDSGEVYHVFDAQFTMGTTTSATRER